jgi:beta-glucanase (GH16 family)
VRSRSRLRPRALVLAAVAAVGFATALYLPSHDDAAEAAIGGITWQDEFNAPAGTPVDGSRWTAEIGGGGWGNNERQYYTNSTSNAVHDGQGNLVITARRENPNNYQCHYGRCEYTSARLITRDKFAQAYGKFEARIKIPRGQGIWPAFWMLGDNFGSVGWPNAGEIDIMENVGKEPNTVYGTVHGPGYSGGAGITGGRTIGRPLADDFHTYAIEWEPNLIRWFLDGQEYHRITPANLGGNRWVFDHPFFMLLNVAVGGNWPGMPDASSTYPQSMVVDYVRVNSWTSGGGGDGGGGTGNAIVSNWHNKCIDVPGSNFNDGQRLAVWDCHGGANQKFEFVNGTLRTQNNKCMDVAWGSRDNGAAIQLATCNGGPAQQFVLSQAGDLVNPQADKCVDIADWNGTNGALLQQWDCSGGANQKWRRG